MLIKLDLSAHARAAKSSNKGKAREDTDLHIGTEDSFLPDMEDIDVDEISPHLINGDLALEEHQLDHELTLTDEKADEDAPDQVDAPIPEIEAEDGQPLEGDAVEEGLELVEGDLDGIDLEPVDVAGEEVPESEAETDVESGKAPEVEAVVPVEESAEETGAEEGEGVSEEKAEPVEESADADAADRIRGRGEACGRRSDLDE